MSEMAEAKHYENPQLWKPERYLENTWILKRFAACAALIPNTVSSILDVGTGNGVFLGFLEKRNLPIRLAGLERSKTAVESAVCKSKVYIGSAESMPFESGAFDLVSLLEVIEHLPYQVYEKVLQEVERVAREYILVSVPYREKRCVVKCPYCACRFDRNYHMRRFNEKNLSTLFKSYQQVNSVKITVTDYIFGPWLQRAHQTLLQRDKLYHATALCPQCGFYKSQNPSASRPAASHSTGLLDLVKKVVPRLPRTVWVVVLYRKIDAF